MREWSGIHTMLRTLASRSTALAGSHGRGPHALTLQRVCSGRVAVFTRHLASRHPTGTARAQSRRSEMVGPTSQTTSTTRRRPRHRRIRRPLSPSGPRHAPSRNQPVLARRRPVVISGRRAPLTRLHSVSTNRAPPQSVREQVRSELEYHHTSLDPVIHGSHHRIRIGHSTS